MAQSANIDFNSALNDLKQTYGKDLEDYRPNFTVLQEMLAPNSDGVAIGDKINLPVLLTHQGGETYGTSGDTSALRNPTAMEIKDAQGDQVETTLPVRMPFGLISKAKQGKAVAYADKAKLILLSGKKGALRANELNLLHGSNGLGVVQAVGSITGTGPFFRTVQFTPATWSDGIWGAVENSPFDFFSAVTAGTKRNAIGDVLVAAVVGWSNDATNPRTVQFTSNNPTNSDLNAIQAGDFVFSSTAYTKQMLGLMNIGVIGSGTTLFTLSTNYSMWRPKVVTITGPLTMGKALSGLTPAIAHGSEGTVSLLVNARNFADLVKDMSSTRRLDVSYNKKKLANGAQAVEYVLGNLTVEVVLHPFMKDGDAIAIAENNWFRIGSDPEPTMTLDGENLKVMSSTSNTMEFRFWSAQVLMPNLLATTVTFQGIQPNAS